MFYPDVAAPIWNTLANESRLTLLVGDMDAIGNRFVDITSLLF